MRKQDTHEVIRSLVKDDKRSGRERLLVKTVKVNVSKVIQTDAGKILFAKLQD